jgi:hypothetical protein
MQDKHVFQGVAAFLFLFAILLTLLGFGLLAIPFHGFAAASFLRGSSLHRKSDGLRQLSYIITIASLVILIVFSALFA